ncbi:MAG: permease-like cell division protein FtsX [Clostridia bacterium]|nr:permease-like cell division protein FtsX [Clostridia bacterium]
MLNSIIYSIKQAFIQGGRNRAMSLASIFSITAMLLILSVFFILMVNMNVAVESAKQDYETIQIYLLDETTQEETEKILDAIAAMPEVDDIYYLSKDDALAQWKADWGDSAYLLDSLPANPLPNALVVSVGELADADAVVEQAQQYSGVEDIMYYRETVEKLVKVTNSLQIAAIVIMVFLVVVSIVVVSNTIKLTVMARSHEISIMKYVGATNWFIRGPFLVEGIIIGLISAAISVVLSAFIYSRVIAVVGQDIFLMMGIPMVPVSFLVFNLVFIFVALGVSIGACGSIISMRRFLDT